MITGRAICQLHLPLTPWTDPFLDRLPGLKPIALDDWITADDAFASQMHYRDELLQGSCGSVLQLTREGEPAARELLDLLVSELPQRPGYHLHEDVITRPDGETVSLTQDEPLALAGRLVQEDLLLLMQSGRVHRLVAGVLCFPAFWSLGQKMGRSLLGAHDRVQDFDEAMAGRVERLLSSLRPGHAVMRANYLIYTDPELHQPAMEGSVRTIQPGLPRYVRVERQTLRRLPETGAIVFAIHTYMVAASALDPAAYRALAQRRPQLDTA